MPAKKTIAAAAVVAHAASPGLPGGGIATSDPAVVAPTAVSATVGAPVTGAPVPREDPLTGGALVPVSGLLLTREYSEVTTDFSNFLGVISLPAATNESLEGGRLSILLSCYCFLTLSARVMFSKK